MKNIVVFSNQEFLFRFFPLFILVYYLVPSSYRIAVLFFASIFFYACGSPHFALILLIFTCLNILFGHILFSAQEKEGKSSRAYLALSVLVDAGFLTLMKVLALKIDSSWLPLGISFYIFKMISYQADIYLGKIKKEPPMIVSAAYFIMFPQIAEGPIMRFNNGFVVKGNGFERLRTPVVSRQKFEVGLFFISLGLGMKVLIADRLGILWNEIEKIGFESISTPLAWMGAYTYSFQLYFDFWGYSLISSGIMVMLGFPFIRNFNHPYAAKSVSDFYRKWHMTLGDFFKDYIYIPLGGSRNGNKKTIANILIVWLVTGLWHGGTLNFVIWGVSLGVIILFEKFVLKKAIRKFPIIGHLNVIILIPLTWVVFAISNLKDLGVYFARLFPFFGIGETLDKTDFPTYLHEFWGLLLCAAVLCVPYVYKFFVKHRKNIFIIIFAALIFWVSVYFSINSSNNYFMYFNF